MTFLSNLLIEPKNFLAISICNHLKNNAIPHSSFL